MKLLSAFPFFFLLATLDPAQSPPPNPTDHGFELRLQPEDFEKDVPEAFMFTLVNTSDQEIRLPQPAIECEEPVWDGGFSLQVTFSPIDGGEGFGRNCSNERTDTRPILERVKAWKTLRPGESIAVKASKDRLFYRTAGAGTYKFRAFYNPPVMTKSDRELLRQTGIIFPEHGLSTVSVTFEKKP